MYTADGQTRAVTRRKYIHYVVRNTLLIFCLRIFDEPRETSLKKKTNDR